MRPEAVEAFVQHAQLLGNPAALHRAGQRARRVLEEAREELAGVLGCTPSELLFTSGGSEADALAVLGGWRARGRGRALVSAVEHPAVLGAREHGAELIPVRPDGVVDLEALEGMLDDEVAVVSVMLVNNETGIRQPVPEVARAALRHRAWTHTDAVQGLGHVPVDFRALGVDMLSVSAHKIGGPVGIGALVARRDVQPAALGLGGGQERGVRSGTQTVALAAAFAAAAVTATEGLAAEQARLRALAEPLRAVARELGARNNTDEGPHAPHVLNLTFPGVRAQDLLFLLDQRGVYASVGSACRAGVHQPSEVLQAMGRTVEEASSTIRCSLGWNTTAEEIEFACDALRRAVAQARQAF